jgi:hypothetical protein
MTTTLSPEAEARIHELVAELAPRRSWTRPSACRRGGTSMRG